MTSPFACRTTLHNILHASATSFVVSLFLSHSFSFFAEKNSKKSWATALSANDSEHETKKRCTHHRFAPSYLMQKSKQSFTAVRFISTRPFYREKKGRENREKKKAPKFGMSVCVCESAYIMVVAVDLTGGSRWILLVVADNIARAPRPADTDRHIR